MSANNLTKRELVPGRRPERTPPPRELLGRSRRGSRGSPPSCRPACCVLQVSCAPLACAAIVRRVFSSLHSCGGASRRYPAGEPCSMTLRCAARHDASTDLLKTVSAEAFEPKPESRAHGTRFTTLPWRARNVSSTARRHHRRRRRLSLRYDGRQRCGEPLRPALPAPPAVGEQAGGFALVRAAGAPPGAFLIEHANSGGSCTAALLALADHLR